ncbi:hypothetical protein WH47_11799 [Habropoda laboriosa]|uniref:Uncharacterized protein n=1 Tax=Habropoda laboriosa TaxID=597456 RepID=A0A0L7R8D2_9HYME|nr:hypothetical protein WH47_11799 [Habropoda laboriosa]
MHVVRMSTTKKPRAFLKWLGQNGPIGDTMHVVRMSTTKKPRAFLGAPLSSPFFPGKVPGSGGAGLHCQGDTLVLEDEETRRCLRLEGQESPGLEIENIFDQSDSDSFNESSDLEQSDEEFLNDPLSDKGEFQNENDEEYIELESDNDSEIIPRRKRRTRCLSSSDSESPREKLDEWI